MEKDYALVNPTIVGAVLSKGFKEDSNGHNAFFSRSTEGSVVEGISKIVDLAVFIRNGYYKDGSARVSIRGFGTLAESDYVTFYRGSIRDGQHMLSVLEDVLFKAKK